MTIKRKFTVEESPIRDGQLDVNQRVADLANFQRELQLELGQDLKTPGAKVAVPVTSKLAVTNLKEFLDSHTRWTNSLPKRTMMIFLLTIIIALMASACGSTGGSIKSYLGEPT